MSRKMATSKFKVGSKTNYGKVIQVKPANDPKGED